MRKLMWFTLGFAAACALGVYLLPWQWMAACSIAALILSGVLFLLRKKPCAVAAVTLLGVSTAMVWLLGYESFYLCAARAHDGDTISAKIEISDYSFDADHGIAADGRIELDGKLFKVRAYLKDVDSLSPGDVVRGEFYLRLTAQGGEEGATHHQGSGIFLLAYGRGEMSVSNTNIVPMKYFPSFLRKNIRKLIDGVFPEDTLAFARALLLGDSTKLTYQEDTAFKVSGIRHVIAVSGLHVSILFSLAYLLAGRKRFLTALIGIPALILFTAVAGFTPSIVRACVMQLLMILALMLKREYDPPTALSAAALVILLVNPMSITSVSFQLSVGCMVGIFLFSKRLHDFFLRGKWAELSKGRSLRARLIRWIVSSVSVTLGAMAATTPLCAAYFGMVSLVGILTNVLALWIVSFAFFGIMLACLTGAAWLPLGKAVAWAVAWPIRYVQLLAKVLAELPLSAAYTCSMYIVAWVVFCYVLLSVFMLSRRKRPVLLICCMLLGLTASVAASYMEPRMDDYRVTVLDVGQGQCILIQKDDHYYMIDCGGDYADSAADLAVQTLLSQGVTSLDGIILTHYDTDHAGGVEALLTRISADALYLPDTVDENGIRDTLERLYSNDIVWVNEDMQISSHGMDISIFTSERSNTGNESCLCILFQVENCDILITGDRGAAAERQLLEHTQLPELELLVVGHHGSASSTSFELLSQTRPAAAVISVGKDNPYGLPEAEVLERLELFGTRVWRTDKQGTIIFRG